MRSVTAWDVRAFGRALSVAGLALLLAWLVTAATDEGGIAWGVRAGRTLPMTPACAAIGVWIALAPGRARGDVLALSALGRAPWQIAMGASLGGALMAVVAAATMAAAPSVDVSGFFPVAGRQAEYVYDGATFVDPARGFRIEVDGSFTKLEAQGGVAAPLPPIPRNGRAAAAMATGFAGVALPLVAAMVLLSQRSAARAAAQVFVTSGLAILLFHAAAVLRVPALAAPLPAMALFAVALLDLRARPSRRRATL